MSDDDVVDDDLTFVMHTINERIMSQKGRLVESEADTRQVLVEPMLDILGWDITDTGRVRREYSPYDTDDKHGRYRRRLDYVLFVNELPYIVIETKKLYSFDEAVSDIERYCQDTSFIGVATDGHTWGVFHNGEWVKIRIDADNAGDELFSLISVDEIEWQGESVAQQHKMDWLTNEFGSIEFGEQADTIMRVTENVNKAVRLFSEFVVANKSMFMDKENFLQMIRAYTSILRFAENKPLTRKILNLFDALDERTKDEIVRLSYSGKYASIHRRVKSIGEKDGAYRWEFLDMIETFTADNDYNTLLGRFQLFRDRTKSGDTATITGIIASLQPEHFMAYNKRSSLPLINTVYHDLANVDMNRYEQFNDIYRDIRQATGKNLVEIDMIANDAYWDSVDNAA